MCNLAYYKRPRFSCGERRWYARLRSCVYRSPSTFVRTARNTLPIWGRDKTPRCSETCRRRGSESSMACKRPNLPTGGTRTRESSVGGSSDRAVTRQMSGDEDLKIQTTYNAGFVCPGRRSHHQRRIGDRSKKAVENPDEIRGLRPEPVE